MSSKSNVGKFLSEAYVPVDVRQSAQFISSCSKYVKINDNKILDFCKKFTKHEFPVNNYAHPLHPGPNNSDLAKADNYMDWIFKIDCLNFCFWSQKNKPWWRVEFEGEEYSGYFGLCAVIKKNPDLFLNINSNMSLEEWKELFKGEDNMILQHLLEERLTILNDVNKTLKTKYNGSFVNVVRKADRSATKLLSIVLEDFPNFRDESVFHGQRVGFYKRAQILVADLYFYSKTFPTQDSLCDFHDIDQLTMFADYRVPQVLNYFGVLEYSDELLALLNADEILDHGSNFEIEIRGNTIEAVERIVKQLNQGDPNSSVNSIVIDVFLWYYRREHSDDVDGACPYHKTICTFY